MLEARTDLAAEIRGVADGSIKGIEFHREIEDETEVTTVIIKPEGETETGKPAGIYITAGVGRIWEKDRKSFEKAAFLISKKIKRLLPKNGKKPFLVCGLGNEAISGDAIGPLCVKKLLVTRHIKEANEKLFSSASFGNCAALSPGVLALTGIESSDIICCVAEKINAEAIIVIDSLSGRSLERLDTTIQLTDTGISPGSGVFNARREISKKITGIPVIAIGVPTVMDAATLAVNLLEEAGGSPESAEKLLSGRGRRMFLTPKESDIINEKFSRLIADGINLAIHDKLTLGEMQEYTM